MPQATIQDRTRSAAVDTVLMAKMVRQEIRRVNRKKSEIVLDGRISCRTIERNKGADMTTIDTLNDRNIAVYFDGLLFGHALFYVGKGWTFASTHDRVRDGRRYHATPRAAIAEAGL